MWHGVESAAWLWIISLSPTSRRERQHRRVDSRCKTTASMLDSLTHMPCLLDAHSMLVRPGGVWLFDVVEDPLEKHDIAKEQPALVQKLGDALDKLKARGIEQRICPVDPLSNPAKFFGGVVTPWRGRREAGCGAGGDASYCGAPGPSPGPSAYAGSLDGVATEGSECKARGWCAAAHYRGPALVVEVVIDGVRFGNVTADKPRAIAGQHGFEATVSCSVLGAGKHSIATNCVELDGGTFPLTHSPMCYVDGKRAACEIA